MSKYDKTRPQKPLLGAAAVAPSIKPIEAPPAVSAAAPLEPAPAIPTRVLAWSGEAMGEALSLLHGVSIEEGRIIDKMASELFTELGGLLRPRMTRAMGDYGAPGLARERAAQAQVISLWLRSFAMEPGAQVVSSPVPYIVGKTAVALGMACKSYEMAQAASAAERRAAQVVDEAFKKTGELASVAPIGIEPAKEEKN